MALTAGIVGLPSVGESTLFNAITEARAEAVNYPFATINPNVGMVEIPDARLRHLTELVKPGKTVPTTFEFTGITGIIKGASKGEGLGNQFLGHIRQVDTICHVVRCFDDENVMRERNQDAGLVDPLADINTISLELALADLGSINKRCTCVAKMTKTKDREAVEELAALNKIKPILEEGLSTRTTEFTPGEEKIAKSLFLLATKPVLYVANVSGGGATDPDSNEYVQQVRNFATSENAEVIVAGTRAEEEIVGLDSEEDKAEFLEAMGIEQSDLGQLIRTAYDLLGLAAYFAAGKQEARAWTFRKGIKAPQTAGVVHGDFERGSIRMETISYEDLGKCDNMQAAKEAGRVRLEGKNYVV